MITVPEEIKERYHRDHCFKNIRIHFPNGERTDICNSLIVKDSVSFTESLCSQNKLKFGLCESPIFECEVVGVGNIKGATIEVSVEIEAPRTLEGVIWRSEIQKYVYPIPYGTFVVDSCKREADMQHRKIVAYSVVSYMDFAPNGSVLEKLNYPAEHDANYSPNLYKLTCEAFQTNLFGFSETELSISSGTYERYWYDADYFYYDKFYFKYYPLYEGRYDLLYHVDVGEELTEDNKVYVVSDWRYSQYDRLFENESDWKKKLIKDGVYGYQYIYPYFSLGSDEANFENDPGRYMPHYYDYSSGTYWGIFVCTKIEYYRRLQTEHNYSLYDQKDIFDPDRIKIYRVDISSEDYTLNYGWTRIKGLHKVRNQWVDRYTADYSQTDFRELYSAFMELNGLFFCCDRNAKWRLVNIKRQFGLTPEIDLYPGTSVYPESVTGGKLLPQDYQSCWYDDEYTKPFGAVRCQYKNTDNEDCVYVLYLAGFNEETDTDSYIIYDLTDNSIIKSQVWTEAQIQELCERIADNVEGVSYMPVDFKGRGLPYVEAGDTFEILTRNNNSITTIVLNHNIVGEQTLTDTYKSV